MPRTESGRRRRRARETASGSQRLAQARRTTRRRVPADSTQTRLLNFGRTNDPQLWLFAEVHGYAFVTKDSDFAELAVLRGAPPKVIWLRIGNCKTAAVERTLRANVERIRLFVEDPEQIVLELLG